jgi:predicted DNA-binding transcriptional regulator YafY
VSFEMPGLESITSFLLSWGSSVTVLEPPELVDRIQSEVQQLADRYGS